MCFKDCSATIASELQPEGVSVMCVHQDSGMWQDALRVCKEYLPHKLPQLQDEYDREMTSNKAGKSVSCLSLMCVCVCVHVCVCVCVHACVCMWRGKVGILGGG